MTTETTCRNCDKPISHGRYCGTICEGMDKFPAKKTVYIGTVDSLPEDTASIRLGLARSLGVLFSNMTVVRAFDLRDAWDTRKVYEADPNYDRIIMQGQLSSAIHAADQHEPTPPVTVKVTLEVCLETPYWPALVEEAVNADDSDPWKDDTSKLVRLLADRIESVVGVELVTATAISTPNRK